MSKQLADQIEALRPDGPHTAAWRVGYQTARSAAAALVADAMAPTFRSAVIADCIDDCWERGSPPTPEEIEPFLRPKVRELVWEASEHGAAWYEAFDARTPFGEFYAVRRGHTIAWSGPRTGPQTADSVELAQAAAQSHWESRAMEFWREAFE